MLKRAAYGVAILFLLLATVVMLNDGCINE